MAIHWSTKMENGEVAWVVGELGRGFCAEIERVGQCYWHWIVMVNRHPWDAGSGNDSEIVVYGFAETVAMAKEQIRVWDENRENFLLAALKSLAHRLTEL